MGRARSKTLIKWLLFGCFLAAVAGVLVLMTFPRYGALP